jgi:hypothetical protein
MSINFHALLITAICTRNWLESRFDRVNTRIYWIHILRQTHLIYAKLCQSRFYRWFKYICWKSEQINNQQDTIYVFLGRYVVFALNLRIPSKQDMSVICQPFVSQVRRWAFQEWSFRISDIKNQKYSEPSRTRSCQINFIVKVKVKVCILWSYTVSVEVWFHSFNNVCTQYQSFFVTNKCTLY